VTGKLNKDGIKEIDPAKVEAFAAQGLTVDQIADCLDCCTSTLYNRMGSEVEVLEAIKRGRAKGVATMTNALFQSGKGGNITAQIFYLKNRSPEDWRDRRDIEVSGELNVPLSGTVKYVKSGDKDV